jgi:hypothetical protein
VIRYLPLYFIQGGYKEKHIKSNGIFKARRRSYFRQRKIQITLGLHILLMTQP